MISNGLKIYQQPHRLFTINSINLCLQFFYDIVEQLPLLSHFETVENHVDAIHIA